MQRAPLTKVNGDLRSMNVMRRRSLTDAATLTNDADGGACPPRLSMRCRDSPGAPIWGQSVPRARENPNSPAWVLL